jgi:hypothetical protein
MGWKGSKTAYQVRTGHRVQIVYVHGDGYRTCDMAGRDGRKEKKNAGLDILREDVAAVMLRLLLP